MCAWLAICVGPARAAEFTADGKLDAALLARARVARSFVAPAKSSRIIVRSVDGRPVSHLIDAVNGIPGRFFPWMGGQVAVIPNDAIDWLASQPEVASISLDRAVRGTLQRTAAGIGARWVNDQLGLDGAGIGVATIDSGVTASHADLDGRVVHFVDFVGAQPQPYDDYGHGTHVAGIIAGSGHDSSGLHRGVAPGAHLVVLKALDVSGNGFTSNVIAAIDYAIANRNAYNIRVINLSVAAGVYESYTRDPLTLAAKRAVDAGIVVVAAAGNNGRGATGDPVYGGIASPGNAPWVLTIGASSDMGTAAREDDVVAAFSARGPSAIDSSAKPDLVAPGVGIESTAEPSSALFAANPGSRLWGTIGTASEPYLRLTGTSMAAPVVAGAIALMLQANPALTPNAVKAILQYTAESRDGYDTSTQGAGFLNARGAVELARTFGASTWSLELNLDPVRWSRHIQWGARRLGGTLSAQSNAWQLGVTWGAARTPDGTPIELECGDACSAAPAGSRR
ncbi:MAG TPA: S8 family peptidase [Vicinamibacterales bacterium]|nr:S8 family peptidase [Vicinamibacterales bacterium]